MDFKIHGISDRDFFSTGWRNPRDFNVPFTFLRFRGFQIVIFHPRDDEIHGIAAYRLLFRVEIHELLYPVDFKFNYLDEIVEFHAKIHAKIGFESTRVGSIRLESPNYGN